MSLVKIMVMFGSDAFKQVIADQLPDILVNEGVNRAVPFFIVADALTEAYPTVNIVGPDSFGHWATIEIERGDEVIAPNRQAIPKDARLRLALDGPDEFLAAYRST